MALAQCCALALIPSSKCHERRHSCRHFDRTRVAANPKLLAIDNLSPPRLSALGCSKADTKVLCRSAELVTARTIKMGMRAHNRNQLWMIRKPGSREPEAKSPAQVTNAWELISDEAMAEELWEYWCLCASPLASHRLRAREC